LPERTIVDHVVGLDHVQLAMPKGQEVIARGFYGALLGLEELAKPGATAGRGGVWFKCGELQLHLGVEEPFAPAHKAHPALRIRCYDLLLDKLSANGVSVARDRVLPGVERSFVHDPFGNRIELVKAEAA
jgi:catechol 2,3-dioxygenase-like lactoylglutathione lyase family enzyme